MVDIITDIPRLPSRPADTHKGDCGKVLIIGGSRGMVGAPGLAANAALRCGAGLVRIAIPEGIQLAVAQLARCATTIPLPEGTDGQLGRYAARGVTQELDNNDCVALGCGMDQSVHLQELVKSVLKECTKPLVIDADGLNNLAAVGLNTVELNANTVLTPHPGEMTRLWASALPDETPPADRSQQAQRLARQCGAVVVLKGADTVVTDGRRTYVNETGNPGMATGGSGDVLTGCIAALLGMHRQLSGLDTLAAAILGVYIHGQAGDMAADEMSEVGMIAEDISDFLPAAWAGHYVGESGCS